ncbi:MAG: hypothetical protein AAGA68_21660 [Pseudomonadota bacterium]
MFHSRTGGLGEIHDVGELLLIDTGLEDVGLETIPFEPLAFATSLVTTR